MKTVELPLRPAKIKQAPVLFIRYFPLELKAAFKAHCAKRGISMKQKIINFAKECVKQDP